MNLKAIGSLFKHLFNWQIFKETYHEWSRDKASRLAASLAYYTATALAPLIVGLLAIVGFVYSREQAQTEVVAQVNRYVGAQGGEVVQSILNNADQPNLARLAGLLSLVALIWSASNIFAQLQDSLDTIWGVELRPDLPILRKIQHRLLPLLTVLGIGLLLLVALVASTLLSAAGSLVSGLIPGGALLWQIVNFFISLAVIALMFAILSKVLPHVEIAWKDVWPGAALTALLFMVGQYALSWYLGRQSGASLYGAAGSLIILLLWLYYSSQIFLFGAEYTQVYATRYGQGVAPTKDAVARDQDVPPKPAARAATTGAAGQQPHPARLATRRAYQSTQLSAAALEELSFARLVVGLIDDGRSLFAKEILLVRTEIQETVMRLARGIALLSGGGLLLYAGVLFVLFAVPLLLWANTDMSLWFALLLIGLLLLIEGWILTVWARHRLANLTIIPTQTLKSVRADGEVVKEHLAS